MFICLRVWSSVDLIWSLAFHKIREVLEQLNDYQFLKEDYAS
jgi:hypothetical protein